MSSSSRPPCPNFKELFQFDHAQIEAKVEKKESLYPGLSLEALYTDLEDLYQIQTHPLVSGEWCDLGSGVGMSALLYAHLYPTRKSFGIELSTSRHEAGVQEKLRLNLRNAELIHASMLDCPIPTAATYFLYFPTGHVLDRLLDQLSQKDNFILVAIESHGDLFARLDLEPNLKCLNSLKLKSKRHHPEARFYQKVSTQESKDILLSLSYQERYLLISEQDKWWGESLELEWMGDDRFNLKHPPRSIRSSMVSQVLTAGELDQDLLNLCQLRRLGELTIKTSQGVIRAFIRKIASRHGFSLELSTGDWVEWKNIQSMTWNDHLCYDASESSFFLPPAH